MAAHTVSRPIRVALGGLIAMMILSLVAVPALGGAVDARGRHRHGHGQQQSARDARDQQVQSAARKPGKRKKGKKRQARETTPGGAQVVVDPGTGSNAGAGTSSTTGTQDFSGGLATSLLPTTETWYFRKECVLLIGNLPSGNPQRCLNFVRFGTAEPGGMNAQIEVISRAENCSPLRFEVVWRDVSGTMHTWRSETVNPGGSAGVHNLGNGVVTMDIYAIGALGGCNFGKLTYWFADIKLTTSSDLSLILVQE